MAVARGVRLGAAESKQTAALFGGAVELYEASGSGSAAVSAAATSLLSRRKVQVLIAAEAEDVDALSQFAESHNLVFMNAASRRASFRSACRRNTFHVEASDVAYQNARALVRNERSISAAGRSGPSAKNDSAMLWSEALERFGASQLNARYHTMFNADMEASAWAGWIAVKTVAEAALRAKSAEPRDIVRFMESPSTQFDGHKGWPLTFRRADHQLRQPLYIVVSSNAAAAPGASGIQDVPDIRQLSGGQNPAALLDRLNAHPGARGCSWLPL